MDGNSRHSLEGFATGTEEDFDFFQFVLDLTGVTAGKQNKQIERILVEAQLSFFRATSNDFDRFLFPAAPAGIEAIENLHLRPFHQRLIKRAPLVHVSGADQEDDVRSEAV